VSILLRPPELQAARELYAAGYLSAAEFKRIEDKAVDEALKLQNLWASSASSGAGGTPQLGEPLARLGLLRDACA